jgi:hypothetical protein
MLKFLRAAALSAAALACSLCIWGSLQCSAELLTPLQGLSRLHTLDCGWEHAPAEVVQAVCQLTGLRELRDLSVHGSVWMKEEGLLLQLTQLKHLTNMHYRVNDYSQSLGIYSSESNTYGLCPCYWVLL